MCVDLHHKVKIAYNLGKEVWSDKSSALNGWYNYLHKNWETAWKPYTYYSHFLKWCRYGIWDQIMCYVKNKMKKETKEWNTKWVNNESGEERTVVKVLEDCTSRTSRTRRNETNR